MVRLLWSSLKMPAPKPPQEPFKLVVPGAVLPLMTQLLTVSTPSLRMPPPRLSFVPAKSCAASC